MQNSVNSIYAVLLNLRCSALEMMLHDFVNLPFAPGLLP